MKPGLLSRRTLLQSAGAASLAMANVGGIRAQVDGVLVDQLYAEPAGEPNRRKIPSTGEELAMIGIGSWRTFNSGDQAEGRQRLRKLMQTFFDMGGQVVDSAPMYGPAERILGELLAELGPPVGLFAATKVLSRGQQKGVEQMERSIRLMGVEPMDLIAVHNLVDWQSQLKTLHSWKDLGKVRYIGVTTHRGRDHLEIEKIMQEEGIDFVQFTYNLQNRKAEERLLPLARDLGIATMINVSFQQGALFNQVRGKPLPGLAAEIGVTSWAQYFLKFIAGHPDVTCIIPATSKLHHLVDNMGANFGPLPDEEMRREMVDYFES
jgi:aryl-alcohol dehydrogenase-like predicted oxidoreductase